MKPDTIDIEVTTTVNTGNKIPMTFDEHSATHLMSMYIDMYTDEELACIREYSTNARDSHIAAGCVERPIEVYTPTSLNAVLRIVDHGTGMDGYDILETYSRYGASTKRDGENADDFNGILGIGCKSALSYTHQFTVVGRKDGVETVISVTRDEDGAGNMDIISEIETDLPNGVEIMIPARVANNFARKAKAFFSFWPEKSVMLDGVLVGGGFDYDLRVTDDLFVINADRYSQGSNSRVVMGGVSYPVELQYMPHGLGQEKGLLAFVPIGSLNFHPSREALRYTKKTKTALATIAENFKAIRNKAIADEISKAATTAEAITTLLRLRKVFNLSASSTETFKYQGKDFPNSLSMAASGRAVLTSSKKQDGQSWNSNETIQTLDVSYLPNTIFIKGWDQASFTATTKKKLIQWLETKRDEAKENDSEFMKVNHFVLVGTLPTTEWITPERIIEWETIRAIKLPRPGRPVIKNADGTTRVSAGEYEVTIVTEDGRETCLMLAEDFDTSVPLFTAMYDKDAKYGDFLTALALKHDEFYFCAVWSNRIAKFERLFPHAQDANSECVGIVAEWRKTITEEQAKALWLEDQYGLIRRLKTFSASRIDDPAVREAIELAHATSAAVSDINKKIKTFRRWVYRGEQEIYSGFNFKNPLSRYSLLGNGYGDTREQEYIYMNALYAHQMAEKAHRKLCDAINDAQA